MKRYALAFVCAAFALTSCQPPTPPTPPSPGYVEPKPVKPRTNRDA